jgi:predicted ATPase/DNA-binding SARP family transcriptional activator
MRFGVLGALAVWTNTGAPVAVPGAKVRALLADLIIHEGHPVSVDRLVDDLWGDAPPANPVAALQVRVSQLRKALDDAEPGARDLVVSRAPGYLLRVEPDAVDAARFAALAARAAATGDPAARAALLADALALWRGPAYADFGDEEFARTAIIRLEEQRLTVVEQHAEARLALGEHDLLAGELGDLVARHPLRERLRAAHMRALYRAGRQAEALDSYHDLRHRLADELGLDPGPELVALYRAILAQDPALSPGADARIFRENAGHGDPQTRIFPENARVVGRPRTNLPAPVTELIGRDAAIAAVRSRLATSRLVTLTGSGGVGKTRLALAVGRELVDAYQDGVWLVELAGADRSTADLVGTVMAALEVRDAPGDRLPARDRLVDALRARQLLLVLDNCEHLVEPVAELAGLLLRQAPGLRILATSREPIGVAGETLWEVPPLKLPEAVRLFAARAAATASGFALDEETAGPVAEVCRRLDGIPLALELAATRVRTLGVRGLAARLDDRFRLLTTGPRDAPPRQRTLTAVIDWSWRLLTEPERAVLRRLAVHVDGCTLEAAEAVCAQRGTLDLLARLVDRSLVVMEDRAGEGPRYRLLESVGAFCLDRLREAGELEAVRQRHARYYLELAERAEPRLYGHDQRHWLRRLDAEAGNLRTTLDTLIQQERAEPALRLAGALARYWFLRGRLTEAHRALRAALGVPGDAPAAVEAKALSWYAGIAALVGDTGDWAARHEAALRRYAEADDPTGRARARWLLGVAMVDLGELAAAEGLLDQVLNECRANGDEWGEAAALTAKAKLAHARGDQVALRHNAERGARLFGTAGDDWGVLQATEWLIGLGELSGEYERAIRLCRDGLRVAEELGMWPDVANRLCWLGWMALELGDYAQAREYCEQGLRIATEQGFHSGQVFATLGLAFAARRDGKLDLAEEYLRELRHAARRQQTDTGQALFLPMVLSELGFLREQRGEPAAALTLHAEAFDVAASQDAHRDMVWALEGMASALALDGRPALAALILGAAGAARRSIDMFLSPMQEEQLNRTAAATRGALGEDAYADAYREGGTLTPSQARSWVDRVGAEAR